MNIKSSANTMGFNSGLVMLAALVVTLLAFYSAIINLVSTWLSSPEYGHGLLIPFVVAYVIWDARDRVFDIAFKPSWLGVVGALLAIVLLWCSAIADLEKVKAYALVLCLFSMVLAFGSVALLKRLAFPLLLLLCAIPLPYLVNKLLTLRMQLISSDLGVMFIRMMGMPVLQEGNVINMGSFKMLVAEACSGLRYMFSLLSISFIVAYFFKAPLWARCLVVLSSIPVTILMNSLRIAATGWIIQNFGQEAAEGFMHEFEGWVVFLVALAFMLLIVRVICFAISDGRPFIQYFYLAGADKPAKFAFWPKLPSVAIAYLAVVGIGGGAAFYSAATTQITVPDRKGFEYFPFVIDGRGLDRETLDEEILGVLKANDTFIGDYKMSGRLPVNLYMVYYEAQKDGAAVHSPKDCLPSGGWTIESLEEVEIPALKGLANRSLIRYGDRKLLVYYWVAQQGLNYANEHKARLMLLKESVVNGRSDAGLVRLTVPVETSVEESDRQVRQFISELAGYLPEYLPH